ncbi:MAG: rod shape-determining protein MreC [Dysgonamonadaceae bacterium]|nr:rod shape-determining protein MreC [Dysgonamonadaceae bacterium]
MRNLVLFILKNIHWLLFSLLAFCSFYLLIYNNEFQRSKYLSAFQEMAGKVYMVSNSVESYMNLKTINSDLMQRIAVLEHEVRDYKKEVETLSELVYPMDARKHESVYLNAFDFIQAQVVNNQISRMGNNYITLNKGALAGLKEDMGVLSSNGIVGVVVNVSPHFARVIPILNPKYQPSCKIKGTDYFGTLSWDGKDSRYISLKEVPQHADFNIGDTIITSGFSTIFPEGVLVGTVEDTFKKKGDNYNSLKIRLFTNFSALSEVLIVTNAAKEEQLNIEKGENDE